MPFWMHWLLNKISKLIIVALVVFLCIQLIGLAGIIGDRMDTATPTLVPTPTTFWQSVTGDISTRVPTSAPTLSPDDALGWAKHYADQYDSMDVYVTDVRLIDSEALGQDICFIVDLRCDHSNTALQFSHLNEFMINICEAMSSRSSFDCVSFTVYDKFVDKYGNAKSIVSITASYKVPTLRLINYDYHMSRKYSDPVAFISCADSCYIHPAYGII